MMKNINSFEDFFFQQYVKDKPTKYGIKIFNLYDYHTFYTYNMDIYAGQQSISQ